jgi:2-keto-4-pentenoate hydratase
MLDERIRRGMSAQLAERRRRLEAGEQALGWKIGFGATSAMQALGIDRPLVGYLMRSAILDSAASLSFADFAKVAVEPEIAVYLGSGLDHGSDKAAIAASIAGLGAAIEIADVAFPPTAGIEAILSGNIYQKAVMLGAVDPRRAGATLTGLAATVTVNGASIDVPDNLEANTGPILDVVAVLADTLAAVGERLQAGELVIVGSIVPPFFPPAGTSIRYTLGEAPPLSIRIV